MSMPTPHGLHGSHITLVEEDAGNIHPKVHMWGGEL